MGQSCQVCSNPKRLDIDRGLVSGASLSSLAKLYGVSENSLSLHRDKHLSRQLMKHQETKEIIQGKELLKVIMRLLERCQTILDRAEADGNFSIALGAIREIRGTIALLSNIAIAMEVVNPKSPRQITVTLVDDNDDDDSEKALTASVIDQFSIKMKREGKMELAEAARQIMQMILFDDDSTTPIRQADNEKPAIDVEPVKRFVRRSKAEPEQAIKDNPEQEPKEDEFEAMRKKYIKPAKVPDEAPTFTDAELDEVDGEGMTLRERLEIRPLFERAH